MAEKRKIAIITARGGSKRIPKKNIKEFCGLPIIAYSIRTALGSGLFDEVMVSTDSEEIAETAKKFGANVPFMRSADNSDDYATTEDVILEVLQRYRELGTEYDYVCCIYPTAPFVTEAALAEAMAKMEKYEPSVVIPLVQFSYPPQRCFVVDDRGYARFKYPQYVRTRSQDLEKQYHDAGQFYIYNSDRLIAANGIIEDDFMPIIMPELLVQDIDTEDDWKIAEMKYKIINNIR
ncbi:MAG: pseudaminic acid cytidylyltransferase [Clostridia bacterium]|nr:pseudaminic acid cytidylyltransferase [[Bacteroides] pectinophilus]MDD5873050.1 pseudaminic acid cytidylyltransferase [Clostridia bacterium]